MEILPEQRGSAESIDALSGRPIRQSSSALFVSDYQPKVGRLIEVESDNAALPSSRPHRAAVDNCAEYYSWTDSDRPHHLRASMDGAAGQVLWEAGPQTTADDVVRLLRNRFGNQN